MKIAVCLGNVPDTTTKVKFAENNTQFDKTGVQWIINPWDELALTRAMELKEDSGNPVDTVTVVTVGLVDAEPTIRKALAIGADNAIRIDAEPKDAFVVASQLADQFKKNEFDIILCGIESSDYNGSAVGGMLAEILEYPSVSAVSSLKISGTDLELTRDIDGGKEVVQMNVPLLAVVQKGITKEPRIPAMRGIMMARKKPLEVVEAVDAVSLTEHSEYELPKPKPPCKMIDPENVKELVDLLQNEAKII
jgi:electron transfer flavoprotein beta subunit